MASPQNRKNVGNSRSTLLPTPLSPSPAFVPSHELAKNHNNREHYDQICRVDGGNRDCRNPPSSPRNKQNREHMSSREHNYGGPEPGMRLQLPVQSYEKAEDPDTIQCWQRNIHSS